MRLLLVDDNLLYIEGLKGYLQDNGVEVVGTAGDGLEALAKVEMLRPDMIVMDVQMDGCDGIEATRLIKRDFPEIEIVMLSVSEEDEHLFAAIRAGASGYLLKGMEAPLFLAELRRLAAGEAPLAPGMARRILREFAGREREPEPETAAERPALSARQGEVLRMLAEGMTYKEIGAALGIREITVRYHVNEILGKLHLANRAQLLAHAARLNL
ncbi:MAG: response regulator transcription factor [Sporomusaceae bacterium]|nr:response regulator transcription factor [Sporomusaceae bacterium]